MTVLTIEEFDDGRCGRYVDDGRHGPGLDPDRCYP
jgi:hypothetical protein